MSESQVTATASAVTHKQLTAKSTGRKFTLYTVETDAGSFTTAKRDIAADAHRLLNKPAVYTVRTEQRGEFTNYYLEEIQEIGSPSSGSTFPAQKPMPQQPQQQQQQAPIGDPVPHTEKDMAIYRQVAAKVAAHISTTPTEFWGNLDDLVSYFATGTKPGEPSDMSGSKGFDPDQDDIPF